MLTPTPTIVPTATPSATAPTASPTPALLDDSLVITVGQATFFAEVADNDEDRRQGLSGRASMPENRAMWFIYDYEHVPTFWMNDMLFPLDIVWVNASFSVVDISANAPAPAPGTPPSDLALYSPRAPAQYVLEINAGMAGKFGIDIGSKVSVGIP